VHDIAIVGGGVVGASLAALLGLSRRTQHLQVALYDPHLSSLTSYAHRSEPRTSALNRSSQTLLTSIGAWPEEHAQPYHRMRVFDESYRRELGSERPLAFDSDRDWDGPLGWIVTNHTLNRTILDRVRQLPSVELIEQDPLKGAPTTSPSPWHNLVSKSKMIVGADGGVSRVRSLAGIGFVQREYGQVALVANVSMNGQSDVAAQVFRKNGPVALLPLPQKTANVVWSTTVHEAQELSSLSKSAFVDRVNELFGPRLEGLVVEDVVSDRLSFPLRIGHASSYYAACPGPMTATVALVGDAAHVVHPLAGQGLNMGMGDAASLALAIANTVDAGLDLSSDTAELVAYDRSRTLEHGPRMLAMDMIKTMFSVNDDRGLAAVVRNVGLGMWSQSSFLRKMSVQIANGQPMALAELDLEKP
jgi:ubiquinone biosynthesis UbiH/UbiF/VisC/COQ6 family hydroxylase